MLSASFHFTIPGMCRFLNVHLFEVGIQSKPNHGTHLTIDLARSARRRGATRMQRSCDRCRMIHPPYRQTLSAFTPGVMNAGASQNETWAGARRVSLKRLFGVTSCSNADHRQAGPPRHLWSRRLGHPFEPRAQRERSTTNPASAVRAEVCRADTDGYHAPAYGSMCMGHEAHGYASVSARRDATRPPNAKTQRWALFARGAVIIARHDKTLG